MKKKKVYVLRVSTKFPKKHRREGEETDFVKKIINRTKITTIRDNWKYWKRIIDKVNKGEALISMRTWTGVPFKSKQEEFMQIFSLGYEICQFYMPGGEVQIIEPEHPEHGLVELAVEDLPIVATNDGLNTADFRDWFKNHDHGVKIIIHFSNLRYATS